MAAKQDPSDNLRTDAVPSYKVTLPSAVRLAVIGGPDAGRQISLGAAPLRVGKAETCALVLTDSSVSRQHLEVAITPAGVLIRDLGSTNGSFYGGTRFGEVTVGVAAVVRIGATELRVCGPDESEPLLPPSGAQRFGRLVGRSRRMRELYTLLERIANSDAPVLIEGETGTGKELCAEALAGASSRAGRPFVICDLGGVSRALVESELFGHVRGAFTGAERDRRGLLAEADGGTLFLDEIGELELDLQPRLLRAIEQRRYRPVGASSYRDTDVRIVAATNRDLREEVRAGRFREDLYHRLAVLRVRLPPLRERKEDLPLLVADLLSTAATVPDETLAILGEYDWPGNVRELKNVLERASSFAAPTAGGARVIAPGLLGLGDSGASAEPQLPASPDLIGSEPYREAKERIILAWERQFVTQLLKRTGGNIARASREGGIDRGYLYRLMKKLGLE